MREDTSLLLEEIARCPVVVSCKSGEDHPCSRVVAAQRAVGLRQHQVPEPWSGHLDEALVLFVGTSPAIARGEDYAVWSDPLDEVAGYFENRFGDGPRQVREGIYPPIPGRHSTTPLQSWVEVKSRAAELVVDPVPGVDYAVTYAVHCRTEGELGVRRAATVCPDRYLRRLVAAARRAHVIVALGPHAAAAVHDLLGVQIGNDVRHVGPVRVEGLDRHVLYLDHFGGYGAVKEVASAVDPFTLRAIRELLAAHRGSGATAATTGAGEAGDGVAAGSVGDGPPSSSEDPLTSLRGAFHALTTSFDDGEPRWLATSGRLADATLSRAGWLLQRSVAERGIEVSLFANPTGLVMSDARRALVSCDYGVAFAADCLRPPGLDRVVKWALQQTLPRTGGAASLAALAVPAPVGEDGAVDGRVLDEVARALASRLRSRARVDWYRVQDRTSNGPVPCLDVYLIAELTG